MRFIRSLEELGREDFALAGSKGAGLGELARMGLPVPPGFVVLTPAYWTFVAKGELQARVEELARHVSDPSSAEAASKEIRRLFEECDVPEEIRGEVASAYEALGRGRVAVRSSATAEDLPEASFAGQYETYLAVDGAESLVAAVRRCWSSLWTARALIYRSTRGLAPSDVALGVVVQRLVEADAAGVLLTANPVNGQRDQMAIDAGWGLGEAVVGGQVDPDHWVADAHSGAILEARIARKELMTRAGASGTELVPVAAELRERAVLGEGEIAALVDLGRRVSTHFGVAQDIEWARAEGAFFLLQSRPITSLFPIPAPASASDAGLRVYVCLNFLQGLEEPITPAGIDFLGRIACGPAALLGVKVGRGAWPPAFKVAAGRAYLDATEALAHPGLRRVLVTLASLLDRPTAEILESLLATEPRLAARGGRPPVHPRVGLVLQMFSRALATLVAPQSARSRGLARVERAIAQLEREAAGLANEEQRRRFMIDAPPRLFPSFVPHMIPLVGPGLGSRFLAEAKLQGWLGDASGLQRVLRSLPYNPTTEMDLALWRLARELHAQGSEPAHEHPKVQAFLSAYGHRAIREIDIGMPRWREDPVYLIDMLHAYRRQSTDADAEAHFRRGAEEAERAARELVEQVRVRRGAVRAWLLRFLLSRVRVLAGLREYPKFFAVRFIAAGRRVLHELGADLVAAGRLAAAEDIFFLRFRDWEDPRSDLRALAAANRTQYERDLARRPVPRVMTSEGATLFAPSRAENGALVGVAASPGVHEGAVRVIRDPRGTALALGEVLVAHGTDPAWTPLFLTAGALVMEIGGTMSHGSIVAREYGIPAVVGVPDAMSILQTGQRVRVDGAAGLVVPLA